MELAKSSNLKLIQKQHIAIVFIRCSLIFGLILLQFLVKIAMIVYYRGSQPGVGDRLSWGAKLN